MKKVILNKKAMDIIMKSKMPDVYKNSFPAVAKIAEDGNGEEAKYTITWHDEDTKDNEYIPYMTFGVVKFSEYKRNEKLQKNKMKKNPKKIFVAKIPVGD